jgi:hypothetical protein
MFIAPGPAPALPDVAEPAAAEQADPPEVLQHGSIDLGALAVEFLLLGIDPYPRKPGVSFEPPRVVDDPAAHPFAVLAALKKDSGAKQR